MSESSQQPDAYCDLVMKGGVTSGIAYPPVILQLRGKYKFRSIGGTSAGAIAAAGIAAAEFNRNHGGGDAGFVLLAEHVQKWLGEKNHLRNLFQPSPATKPLMDFGQAFLKTPPPVPPWLQVPSPFQ